MLLQQEGINVGTDLCQSGIVGQIALRHRKPLQPLFEFSKSPIDVHLLCREVPRPCFVGSPDLTLQFIDLGLHRFNRRMVFGVGRQERFFLHLKLGKGCRHLGNQRIVLHHSR